MDVGVPIDHAVAKDQHNTHVHSKPPYRHFFLASSTTRMVSNNGGRSKKAMVRRGSKTAKTPFLVLPYS